MPWYVAAMSEWAEDLTTELDIYVPPEHIEWLLFDRNNQECVSLDEWLRDPARAAMTSQ